MDARIVARFLLKVFLLLAVLLLAWQKLSLASLYHSVIAAVTDAVYDVVRLGGFVHGVASTGPEFLVRVRVGTERAVLHIAASDITSNLCTLLALYLASPVGPNRRLYAGWLAGALGGLLLVHVVTVIAATQSAVASHPAHTAAAGPWTAACGHYLLFYEQMGMYLLVLVLWLPYIVTCLRGRSAPGI